MKEKNTAPKTEKKAPARMNSADLMILMLCIVCIVGMVLRFGVLEKIENEANADAAAVTVLIEGVSSTSKDLLALRDNVYIGDGSPITGSVSSILSVAPSPVYEYGDDGSITQMNSVNGKVDIRAVLSVNGRMSESGFLLEGTTYIAPNMTLSLKTEKLSVIATVIDVTVME